MFEPYDIRKGRIAKEGDNMSVRKYRKKPVVIEAMLFYGSNYNDVVRWIMNDDRENEKPKDEVTIQTLEGVRKT